MCTLVMEGFLFSTHGLCFFEILKSVRIYRFVLSVKGVKAVARLSLGCIELYSKGARMYFASCTILYVNKLNILITLHIILQF